MVDLTNPSPLVMTHFELVAFTAGLLGVVVTVIFDRATHYWDRHGRK
jgi:hypothetical protein